jgi:ABC-type lipoprotein export system ATPase subunit
MPQLNELFECIVEYRASGIPNPNAEVKVIVYQEGLLIPNLDFSENVKYPNFLEKMMKISYEDKIKRAQEKLVLRAKKYADSKLISIKAIEKVKL